MTHDQDRASTWGRLWIAALERLATSWQSRLPRGRDYANKGHVISLTVNPGRVVARVQGSRSKPYSTHIDVPVFREHDWNAVIRVIAEQSRFAAQLLAGEMPPGINDIFNRRGLQLFPVRNSEMLSTCTCPDKARPCKHIAAVHYAFGEALDRDPFLLFQLRGADRRVLVRGFRRAWFGQDAATDDDDEDLHRIAHGIPVMPLSADRFNRAPSTVDAMSFTIRPPEQSLLILSRLGAPVSWQLPIGLADLLGPVYEDASGRALEIALAEGLQDEQGMQDDESLTMGGDYDDDYDDDEDEDEEEGAPRFKALQTSPLPLVTPPPPEGEVSASASFLLPKALGASKSKKVEANDEPESERANVLIRKGVATLSRRRNKRRTTGSLKPLSETDAQIAVPANTQSDTGPVRRRRVMAPASGDDPANTTSAETATLPTARSAPSSAGDDDTSDRPPVVRRRAITATTDTVRSDRLTALAEAAARPAQESGAYASAARPARPTPSPQPPVSRPEVSTPTIAPLGKPHTAPPPTKRKGRERRTSAAVVTKRPTSANNTARFDEQAQAALEANDGAVALEGAVEAWRAAPSVRRYLVLMAAGDLADAQRDTVQREADLVIDTIRAHRRMGPGEMLLLLTAHRFSDVAALLETFDLEDADDADLDAALTIFIVFTLMAAVGDDDVPANTHLASVYDDVYARGEDWFEDMQNPPAPVGAWLDWTLDDADVNDAFRDALLHAAKTTGRRLLGARRYESRDDRAKEITTLIGAIMETLHLSDREDDLAAFTRAVRGDVSSKRRLFRALDEAIESSATLRT